MPLSSEVIVLIPQILCRWCFAWCLHLEQLLFEVSQNVFILLCSLRHFTCLDSYVIIMPSERRPIVILQHDKDTKHTDRVVKNIQQGVLQPCHGIMELDEAYVKSQKT